MKYSKNKSMETLREKRKKERLESQKALTKTQSEMKIREMEKRAQLPEQGSRILKKYQIASVLTGKTKGVYCALSTSQCADYGFFKGRIFQGYELVPEAYH